MPATTEVKTGFFLMIGIIAAIFVVGMLMGLFRGFGG